MRRVSVHKGPQQSVALEVDGVLDLVAGHDLRRLFDSALRTAPGVITFDLSRVSAADDDGVAALAWCCARACAVRRRLMWDRCSQPLRRRLDEAASL